MALVWAGRCVCWRVCPGPCLTLGGVRSCCGSGGHGSPTAASSQEGECPRFLVALRSWSLVDSIALVEGRLLRQWGRNDAVPRGREAPGTARTGLGFPSKSPSSGGSAPRVGLSEALQGPKGRHRVWRAWTPRCCPSCGAAMPPPGLAWRGRVAGGPRRHGRQRREQPPPGTGRALTDPARIPCAARARGRRASAAGTGSCTCLAPLAPGGGPLRRGRGRRQWPCAARARGWTRFDVNPRSRKYLRRSRAGVDPRGRGGLPRTRLAPLAPGGGG